MPLRDGLERSARRRWRVALTLHGRIANLPAHRLEVQIDDERKSLRVIGDVDEGGLFYPHLSLRTTYTTPVGSNLLEIEDVVVNRSSQPTEMQLLYHLNMGPPFLEAGSRVHIPIAELWPSTAGRRGHRIVGSLRGAGERVRGASLPDPAKGG